MEQNLNITDVVLDPCLQVRERIDESWVQELESLYRGLHRIEPVVVVFDGTRYLLVEGWHRIEAQRRIEPHMVIAADVIDASKASDPMAVAKMRAAMSNREGGLRRSDGDKKRAILLLRSTPEGRKMTQKDIAQSVGVVQSYVCLVLGKSEISVVNYNGGGSNIYGGAPTPSVGALWSQVDAALKADPGKSNADHSRDLKCAVDVVRRRRATLDLPAPDPTRYRDTSNRDAMIEDLRRDSGQGNCTLAERHGVSTRAVAKAREELGLPPPKSGPKPKASLPPSAPINPKRADDPREQGAEILPSRPPPSRKPDVVTDYMQRFERLDRLDQQTIATALYTRWPHFFLNAIEEQRDEAPVLQ